MFFEMFIVGVWEIVSEVDASTFLPHLGCPGHKLTNGEHILAFPALWRVKDFVHYILLPEFNDFLGFFQRLSFSCDADISPHKGSK